MSGTDACRRRCSSRCPDSSASDGFKPVADVTLSGKQVDGETFNASAQVPGRWVRMTVKSLPTGDIAQIMEFRAFGERLTHDPAPNVTGTYKTDAGDIHLKQDGLTSYSSTETGSTSQISLAYSATVRSALNQPLRAVL